MRSSSRACSACRPVTASTAWSRSGTWDSSSGIGVVMAVSMAATPGPRSGQPAVEIAGNSPSAVRVVSDCSESHSSNSMATTSRGPCSHHGTPNTQHRPVVFRGRRPVVSRVRLVVSPRVSRFALPACGRCPIGSCFPHDGKPGRGRSGRDVGGGGQVRRPRTRTAPRPGCRVQWSEQRVVGRTPPHHGAVAHPRRRRVGVLPADRGGGVVMDHELLLEPRGDGRAALGGGGERPVGDPRLRRARGRR